MLALVITRPSNWVSVQIIPRKTVQSPFRVITSLVWLTCMLNRDSSLVDYLQVGVQVKVKVQTSVSNGSTTASQHLRSTVGAAAPLGGHIQYSSSTEAKSIYIHGIKSTMLGCWWY